ncbi:MAG: cysteine desulfurase [Bacteroidota bacterium]|nr:cysteine desulfurase [Bacteroidota bacterium]
MLDIIKIRKDFPILEQKVNGKQLVYFDNAATTQKPIQVIEALNKFYTEQNSNIHRGVHHLSQIATTKFEESRITIQKFINASKSHEIIFTRGTTESINLVASSFGKKFITDGDEIIISEMEHHSNIVPWQIIAEEKKAILRVLSFDDNAEISIENFKKLITPKTKIVAINHISNSLGTINPIKEIIEISHKKSIPVLIDGAQSASHIKIDVNDLDCDFYCFSGHKILGPTGIGVLYGKEQFLNAMPPYQSGGEMIDTVTFEKTTFKGLPFKFEAGTPDISGAIGLAKAIEYIKSIGIEKIAEYENELLNYATEKLISINGMKIYGNARQKSAITSFNIGNIHPYDIGILLDQLGVAVRTGHLCTQPIMNHYNIPGLIRASYAFYNTFEEIDIMIDGIKKVKQMLE